jgi:hypothetical protein
MLNEWTLCSVRVTFHNSFGRFRACDKLDADGKPKPGYAK